MLTPLHMRLFTIRQDMKVKLLGQFHNQVIPRCRDNVWVHVINPLDRQIGWCVYWRLYVGLHVSLKLPMQLQDF